MSIGVRVALVACFGALILPSLASTNVVFLETMGTSDTNRWGGDGCDNVWAVTGNAFAQSTNWNYGAGNPCGMQFKQGTATLGDNMIATGQGIAATGTSGHVEFYLKASGMTTNTGWTLQLDAGTGYVTRLSDLSGANHAWQLYHCDLLAGELVSNLYLRFQFAGGVSSNRINLDLVSVRVVTAGSPGFGGSLVLGRPTAHSVTVSALADEDEEAYFEYGTQPGVYSAQTAVTNLNAGEPTEWVFGSLQANTRYYYRLRFRTAGATNYLTDAERTFATQRAPGSSFTFCIQGDSHPERTGTMFDADHYANTLRTAAADRPDFYMSIGDDFSVDKIPSNQISRALVAERYAIQRPWLGLVAGSAPLFLVNGNHEQASLANFLSAVPVAPGVSDATLSNIAVWAQTARNTFFPEPAPDGSFYGGMTNDVLPGIGPLRSCYAWTWGDALFVTLDPYWYSTNAVDNQYGAEQHPSANKWLITHGDAQYRWLKATLEQSAATYKFVFAHHVMGTGRGGVEAAPYYEWGGRNDDGTWGFTANRPDWALPIHQLLASNHVTIVFQGHDHIFARQQLDGVTYQALPNPADPNYSLFNADAYTNCLYKTNNTGYVRVTVAPENVKVDYVRTYLPTEEEALGTNGMVDYSYTLTATATDVAYDVILGRPTDSSIAVSVLADADLQAYVEYGTRSGVYTGQTVTNSVTNGIPSVIPVERLEPNQSYVYRLRYSTTGGPPYRAGPERVFATQRARGSTFTFDIEADPHYNDIPGTVTSVWQQTLANVAADHADFLIDLGDTFMGEKYVDANGGYSMSQAGIAEAAIAVRRQFFSVSGHSVPLFLVNGNHDPELGWWLSTNAPHANPAVLAAAARELHYPCPSADDFYSGAASVDYYQQRPRDAYYAFEWGDALLVMLDPFWFSGQGASKSPDPWAWTLGTNQYYWLKSTLENSSARYKFVFAHHLVGGSFDAQGRGGMEYAPYFEWGGLNTNGSPGFVSHRPGWPMPIQDLLLTNGVQVFFHGHDHLFVKQDYHADGDSNGVPDLIYQEVPQPSHYPYDAIGNAPKYGYTNGIVHGSSGHLRVTVSPTQALVEYVRSYRPSDEISGVSNRTVAYSYTIAPRSVDTVRDGVPDWWRAQWFGGDGRTTNGQSCAAADPDGDGMSNWQEFLADTAPTNGASLLAILGVRRESNGVQLVWIGGSGATQVVESRGNLLDEDEVWSGLYTNLPPTEVTNALEQPEGLAVTNRCFRIKAWR